MTRRIFSILIAVLVSTILYGQKNHKIMYFAWTLGAEELFFPKTDGQLQVSFPYSTTDASGTTTRYIFTSKHINPYPKPQIMVSVLNFELGGLRNYFSTGIYTYATTSSQVNFSSGYGHNFYFDLLKNNAKEKTEKNFIIKPSLSINFNHYRCPDATDKNDNYFGNIDNQNKTVNLLGYTSPPTHTYHYTRGNRTVSTKTIDIFFAQNDWALVPKVSLTNNQNKHNFRCQIDAGYYFLFSQKGGVQIFRNKSNSIKPIIGLADNGITTTFNQKTITATPYKFSGIFASITAGLNFTSRLFK